MAMKRGDCLNQKGAMLQPEAWIIILSSISRLALEDSID